NFFPAKSSGVHVVGVMLGFDRNIAFCFNKTLQSSLGRSCRIERFHLHSDLLSGAVYLHFALACSLRNLLPIDAYQDPLLFADNGALITEDDPRGAGGWRKTKRSTAAIEDVNKPVLPVEHVEFWKLRIA